MNTWEIATIVAVVVNPFTFQVVNHVLYWLIRASELWGDTMNMGYKLLVGEPIRKGERLLAQSRGEDFLN